MSDELPQSDKAEGCAHPRETFQLLGHAKAEATFIKSVQSGRMHHAWLISGPSGVGKATLAYRMIRYLLGGRGLLGDLDIPSDDPVAGRIAAQGHGNLFVVKRPYDTKSKKLKSEIPVAEIRRLTEFFRETAAEEGLPRIGLIDKADELNANSENAVLKLLEEPPDGSVLILLADAPGRLLPTIRSRCFQLDLRPVPEPELKRWLAAQRSDEDHAELAVQLSRGAPGRAVALLQSSQSVLEPLTQFAESLSKGGAGRDLGMVSGLSGARFAADRALFWSVLQDYLALAAKHAAGQAWTLPLSPPPSNVDWRMLHTEAIERERLESDINMEQRSSLLDFLGQVRAA